MKIRKLVMHNFGIYASTNVLEFQEKKSVVLIGGMNGRGKTTILEAVLLSLYGANSPAFKESRFATYGQYLRSYINRQDQSLQTYVEIEFIIKQEQSEVYCVHRGWDGKGQRVREQIWVRKNGIEDKFLTNHWAMYIESLLPSALSSFFFFDGEKIAELALEDTSEQIKESIKALLGISVLDVLDHDLSRIIRRIEKKKSEDRDFAYIESLREKKEEADRNLGKADQEIEEVSKQLNKIEAELEQKSAEYSAKGGDMVEKKYEMMHQRSDYICALNNSQEHLLELAGGEMPFLLVKALIQDIQDQGLQAHKQKVNRITLKKVQEYYEVFSDKNSHTEAFVDFIKENIDEEQRDVYCLSDSALLQVIALNGNGFGQSEEKAKQLLEERDVFQNKVGEIDHYLSVDLDENECNELFREMKQLEEIVIEKKVELNNLYQKRMTLNGIAITASSHYSKAAEYVLDSLEIKDSDQRTLKYAHMATDIISLYRIRLQERKTDLLAETMTECYRQLANKKYMIEKIEMDPITLDLHYFSGSEEITKERLSAGEKQLMVISLLWALAICSKKKLPVIIDTPLSRLDSFHRRALTQIYFPNASEQTIILSTDSEINESYYKLMKKSIGDEFTLEYNEKEKKTTIRRGYFSWGDV